MPAFVFVSVFHASVLLLIMNFVVKKTKNKTKPKPFKLRIELIEKTEEHPSSETQGLLAGTMRYFRSKVFFKSCRAPRNLFLPN